MVKLKLLIACVVTGLVWLIANNKPPTAASQAAALARAGTAQAVDALKSGLSGKCDDYARKTAQLPSTVSFSWLSGRYAVETTDSVTYKEDFTAMNYCSATIPYVAACTNWRNDYGAVIFSGGISVR
jgi:hypothetical protein